MKLKKIASLMLAGVMVVSTLAGCSGKETDKTDDKEDNEIVTTSNAVTYANDALSASEKEYITVKASSTLDGWVKDIATDTGVFKASDIEYTYKNLTKAEGNINNSRIHQDAMRNKLTKKLKDSNVVCVGYINTGFNSVPADKKSQAGSLLYTVSGMLDEKSAVESVVSAVHGVECPKQIDSNKYNCEYTAEISSVKVTNDSLNGESAWVIAVVITQNVTEAANVQV